jgi:hypothetical protein
MVGSIVLARAAGGKRLWRVSITMEAAFCVETLEVRGREVVRTWRAVIQF